MLADVSKDIDIYDTESFGPIVSIMTFKTEEEALAVANNTDYRLSRPVFSENLNAAMQVARKYESGAVHINFSYFLGARGSQEERLLKIQCPTGVGGIS